MTMGDRVAVLNDGLLQQVDTPLRLYDNPANLFVAGFIGSPAMNLLDAKPTDPADVIARVDPRRPPQRGSAIQLAADSQRILAFDAETGARLS